jgi:hypothetical protein
MEAIFRPLGAIFCRLSALADLLYVELFHILLWRLHLSDKVRHMIELTRLSHCDVQPITTFTVRQYGATAVFC